MLFKLEIGAMMQLIMTACLMVTSFACREVKVDVHEQISELHCALGAQWRIAAWSDEHPTWRITRWCCNYKTLARF
ncbi:MAG: hypothetical protein C0519_14765 [Hyphomicrobium sp.]|nr:hypothetical protein [Hyphomicrobium sp.]PPD07069.1 MAG: hypothetical protein CTY28_11290 [Hyphomicrobium sp.]